MSGWIENAESQIEESFLNGDLTQEEYQDELRDLQEEIIDNADRAGLEAYENALNGH